MMAALLSPRFWIGLAIVAALSFSHVFVYHSGRAAVRVVLDQERAAQVQAALTASEKRRNDEKALTIINQGVTHAYAKTKSRRAAAAAANADRLRELQATHDRGTSADSAPLGGADDPRDAIIYQCAGALAELDDYAAGVAAKASALQDYARQVCLSPR